MRIRLKKNRMKINMMSHLKRRTLIKGEMKMIKKFRTKDHRTQESTKQFKEITPSTPYLVSHPVIRDKVGCISYMRQGRQHI
jgi:hypothetical protein